MAGARTEKIMFTCTPEMKEYLTHRAVNERRSVSNLVEGLLLEVIGDSLVDEQPEQTTKSSGSGKGKGKGGNE
jgi:hypothetical protein